jgi:peptidyl-tRNA hydrolase
MLDNLKITMFRLKKIPMEASEAYDEQSSNLSLQKALVKVKQQKEIEKTKEKKLGLEFEHNRDKTMTNLDS